MANQLGAVQTVAKAILPRAGCDGVKVRRKEAGYETLTVGSSRHQRRLGSRRAKEGTALAHIVGSTQWLLCPLLGHAFQRKHSSRL